MNTVRTPRTEIDIAIVLLRARLRRERRLRAFMPWAGAPVYNPTAMRRLDELHEATHLVANLEARLDENMERLSYGDR
jgi:hypothetical protein